MNKYKVLIVEDDDGLRGTLCEVFERDHFAVDRVGSGAGGLGRHVAGAGAGEAEGRSERTSGADRGGW